jgi:hypothetical protein
LAVVIIPFQHWCICCRQLPLLSRFAPFGHGGAIGLHSPFTNCIPFGHGVRHLPLLSGFAPLGHVGVDGFGFGVGVGGELLGGMNGGVDGGCLED